MTRLRCRMEGRGLHSDAPLVLVLHGHGMDQDSMARSIEPLLSLPVRFLIPTAPLRNQKGTDQPSWYDYDGNQERFLAELARKAALESTWERETDRLVDAYRRAMAIAASGGIARKLHRAA